MKHAAGHWALLLSAVAALGGCTAPWVVQRNCAFDVALPQRYTVARPPLVIHSDFPLPAHDAAAGRADGPAARELGQRLGLPPAAERSKSTSSRAPSGSTSSSATAIRISPTAGRSSSRPTRELVVYAQGGDRLADDLRHEMTHAYLHSVVPDVPLWLDEGLAKYFELPARPARAQPAICAADRRSPCNKAAGTPISAAWNVSRRRPT